MCFFVNLLMYFNADDLAYQDRYPLSIVEASKGLLNEGAIDGAINFTIERGNVMEVVDKAKGQPIPAYKHYRVREGSEVRFFQ
jgi:hypothetical protein